MPAPLVDELDHLATVEHALCVQYLYFHCALGDLALDPGPGPAGGLAGLLAQDQMRRLRTANRALVAAGGQATVGRATHVRHDAGPPLALPALRPEALDTFLERCGEVAVAVDARYGHLRGLAAAADPPLGPDVRAALDAAVDTGLLHAEGVAMLRDRLAGLEPGDYVRVRPEADPAAGTPEAGILRLGDLYYQTIVEAVRLGLAHGEELGDLIPTTVDTMFKLEEVHRKLAERGQLPTFTLAPVS